MRLLKRLTALSLLALSFILGGASLALASTPVGGILTTDTTWTTAQSPYILGSDVQVAEGCTLTVEPGVHVVGEGRSIRVWGGLAAIGRADSRIAFDQTTIKFEYLSAAPVQARVEMRFCMVTGGAFLPGPYAGNVNLSDSRIMDVAPNTVMMINNPSSDCYIERNIFRGTPEWSLSVFAGQSVYFRDNVFYGSYGWAVGRWPTSEFSTVELTGNTLYPPIAGSGLVRLTLGDAAATIDARGNYWPTTDIVAIPGYIFDRTDDLGCPSFIPYLPVLNGPSSGSPHFDLEAPALVFAGLPSSGITSVPVSPSVACADTDLEAFEFSVDGVPGSIGVGAEGIHTVSATAMDTSGNRVSATHQFRIDKTQPMTASDAGAAYHGAAVIRLTAMDAASGVAATYYKLDGVQSAGTSISTSAIGSHTLEFWSVDAAGNVESHKTVSFTILRPVVAKTKVSLGTPVAPKTMMRTKYYTVYGLLKPRHAARTYPVRIYKYRYVSGHWRSYGYVNAKASNYFSYTKYSVKMRLAYKGKWRLRAYAPADSKHLARWSSAYDYVTVK